MSSELIDDEDKFFGTRQFVPGVHAWLVRREEEAKKRV